MQLDIVSLSLEYAASVVPKKIMAPDIRVNSRGYCNTAMSSNKLNISPGAGGFRNVAISSKELFRDIVETAPNVSSSERGFFRLYELAKRYFDSISDDVRAADIEETREQIIYIICLLAKSSFEMAEVYRQRWNGLNQEKIVLDKEKSDIFGKLEQDKKQCQYYLEKIDALDKKCVQLEHDAAGYMADVIRARQDLDNINHKQHELRKWCWVPFYNIYLLVDADKALSHLRSCQQRLDIAQRAHNALMTEKEELQRSMMQVAGMEHETKERISKNEQAMQTCIQNINDTQSKALQCSDIALYFGVINKRLELGDGTITFMDTIVPEIKQTFVRFLGKDQALFNSSAIM